jgi:hypothetical protein
MEDDQNQKSEDLLVTFGHDFLSITSNERIYREALVRLLENL